MDIEADNVEPVSRIWRDVARALVAWCVVCAVLVPIRWAIGQTGAPAWCASVVTLPVCSACYAWTLIRRRSAS